MRQQNEVRPARFVKGHINGGDDGLAAYLQEIPMPEGSKCYVGKNVTDIQPSFQKLGFTNVKITKITQKGLTVKDGQVLNIRINGRDGFDMCEWYPVNSDIVINTMSLKRKRKSP